MLTLVVGALPQTVNTGSQSGVFSHAPEFPCCLSSPAISPALSVRHRPKVLVLINIFHIS